MPTIGTTICLVCGYSEMEPLEIGIICPSCGTQYGISDEELTYPDLRQQWIHHTHAKWWSRYTPEPAGWSPIEQLRNINYRCSPSEIRILTRGWVDIVIMSSGQPILLASTAKTSSILRLGGHLRIVSGSNFNNCAYHTV